MASAYSRGAESLIKDVLKVGAKYQGKKLTKLESDYIEQLYTQTPIDYITKIDTELLYIAASQHFKFSDTRKPDQPWVFRLYNPDQKKHGWTSERTILELNMVDSPFILDSITAELIRGNYIVYEVIHPIVRMDRDDKGKIKKIYDVQEEDKKAESCIHIQISHIGDAKELKALSENIERVLSYVRLTVDDFGALVGKANAIADDLSNKTLPYTKAEVDETYDFMQWAIDNNFIFMGYREYRYVDSKGAPKLQAVKKNDLGVFNAKKDAMKPVGLEELPPEAVKQGAKTPLLEITKSTRRSLVHRSVQMDYISIKIFDGKKLVGEHRLLGLFTSAVYHQSARSIPIIRKKIEHVMQEAHFAPTSHNSKALVAILEGYPRDELLQVGHEELFEHAMGIVELAERPATKLFLRKDRYNRFISCLVYVPKDRFNTGIRERVREILEKAFSGTTTDFYTQMTESPLARMLFLIKQDEPNNKLPELGDLQQELRHVTNSWYNGLRDRLISEMGERDGEQMYRYYVNAFSESYKQSYHFGGTYHDIVKIEKALKQDRLSIELYKLEDDDEYTYQVKIFAPKELVMLSEVMPVLENMGFDAIDQHTYACNPEHQNEKVWILHFRLKVSRDMKIRAAKKGDSPIADIKDEFQEAMYKIWHGEIENDALNKLILRAKMTYRDVIILRGYLKYIVQTSFPYSQDYMASAIARYPKIAAKIIELFHARFALQQKSRVIEIDKVYNEALQLLAGVESVVDDRVLKQFLETIQSTLRTNAFQQSASGEFKDYLSFKLDSNKVPNLPLPRPFREIWVYACHTEGIHLRGGKVARGGLRWSDRPEDFRTEVLGLVKAQMVKNAVIVPVGSKGGFVMKRTVNGGREEFMAAGIESYKTFLSGLLDITDNIVKGKVVPPKDVVRHDEDDPYLVVAADKGTATFSDIANGVAQDYGFWLDDAFASGGSVGYDHKKMGITARGAWVSVKRHFAEMGHDSQSEDFTCVGIGDMSGDVFGNGMLLSKHIRLQAAFNHLHIFIDPNPDAAKSYKERDRLFKLPRSGWTDYDQKLISKGGAIFDRSSKELKLTPEIKKMLDVKESKMTPEELIRAILKAPVDLLWNGGIGTYVKADHESHEQVGDKANDMTRVNAKEVRARVIGEGGNLGLTQDARIEYALNGGRINTDAIDNSAGVDCSDHEVNIKIALGQAVQAKKITTKQRNTLLESMTDEVGDLVLKDNSLQTQAITIAELAGTSALERKSRLMRSLEDKGLLDRIVENLPDDEALAARAASGKGLSRPELSVIMSYAKIDVYNQLIASGMPDDPYFTKDLIEYFPVPMRKKYQKEIEGHQLRREIITTAISNSIVNRVGSSFFTRMIEQKGKKGCDVARAYTITRDAFGLRDLWAEIEKLGSAVPVHVQVRLYRDIERLVERCASWFLRYHSDPLDATKLVEEYQPGIKKVAEFIEKVASDPVYEVIDRKQSEFLDAGVPKTLARKVAQLEALASACDIVFVTKESKLPMKEVGEVYYTIGSRLHLGWLRIQARKLISDSHWDNMAISSIIETIYDVQMRLTETITANSCDGDVCQKAIAAWYQANEKGLGAYDHFMKDIQKQENVSTAMLLVCIQRAEELL